MDLLEHESEEDVKLKAALKSVLGKEQAPRALRDRVVMSLALLAAPSATQAKSLFVRLKELKSKPISPTVALLAVIGSTTFFVAGYEVKDEVEQRVVNWIHPPPPGQECQPTGCGVTPTTQTTQP